MIDHADAVRRILAVYDAATPEDLAEGEDWYATAQDFCAGLAGFSGYPLHAVCGVVAALSPQRSWGENQRAAHRLCTGRPIFGLTRNTEKARRILQGETIETVLQPPNPKRITGRKVRAFYENLTGNEIAVTVDRHAACIAGVCDHLDSRNRYVEVASAYQYAATVRHTTPSTMQAVTWVAWRALKHPNNRGAYG